MEGAALLCLLCLQSWLLVNTLNYADKETSKLTVERRREHVGSDAIKALPAEGTGLKSLESSAAQLKPGPVLLAYRERRDTDSERKKKKFRPGGTSLVGKTVNAEATKAPSTKRVARDADSKRKRPRVGLGAFSVISIIMEPTRKPAVQTVLRVDLLDVEEWDLSNFDEMPNTLFPDKSVSASQKLQRTSGAPVCSALQAEETAAEGQEPKIVLSRRHISDRETNASDDERSRRQLPTSKTKPKRKPRVGSFSLLSHKQPKSLQLQVTRVRRQLDKKKKPPGRHSVLGEAVPPNTVPKTEEKSATEGDED